MPVRKKLKGNKIKGRVKTTNPKLVRPTITTPVYGASGKPEKEQKEKERRRRSAKRKY
tara:strand:- start:495 stop:668 length:174 start_codon:yes stop_codon:yes gene_type:complete